MRTPEEIARLRPFDEKFWGPEGPDPSRWGSACMRGLEYANTGAPVASGTKNVERKISTGRKARGMASDGVKG